MGKSKLTASIVTYHDAEKILKDTIDSFSINCDNISSYLYIVDNSTNDSINKLCNHQCTSYIFNNSNLGFGKAHNIAIQKAIELDSEYHLILNPDVYFDSGVLKKLIRFMDNNQDVGLVMPKILYPNGDIQYLCKLLPTPFDWIFRRFSPFKKSLAKRNEKYELRFTRYNKTMEVPSLSGCFMFIRTSVLQEIGGFDERFFMYAEDVDLCRRIGEVSKTVYYPVVEITHNYEKGSYKNRKLLFYHIKSAIQYFNKWGWIFDKGRKRINKKTLERLDYK